MEFLDKKTYIEPPRRHLIEKIASTPACTMMICMRDSPGENFNSLCIVRADGTLSLVNHNNFIKIYHEWYALAEQGAPAQYSPCVCECSSVAPEIIYGSASSRPFRKDHTYSNTDFGFLRGAITSNSCFIPSDIDALTVNTVNDKKPSFVVVELKNDGETYGGGQCRTWPGLYVKAHFSSVEVFFEPPSIVRCNSV